MPNKDKAKKKAAAKKLSAAKATAKIKSFLKHLFTVNRGLKLLSVLLAVAGLVVLSINIYKTIKEKRKS